MVFFIRFIVIMAILFLLDIIPWTKTHIVDEWTQILAYISSSILHVFDPNVISQGIEIRDKISGRGVRIEAGCNGIEATIILVAAMFGLEIHEPLANAKQRMAEFFSKIVIGFVIFYLTNAIVGITMANFPELSSTFLISQFIMLSFTGLIILGITPIYLTPSVSLSQRIELLRFRVISAVLGFIAIQLMNTLRIICLYYLYLWDLEWFEFAHIYLWPALLVIDAVIVFIYWLYRVQLKYGSHTADQVKNTKI